MEIQDSLAQASLHSVSAPEFDALLFSQEKGSYFSSHPGDLWLNY